MGVWTAELERDIRAALLELCVAFMANDWQPPSKRTIDAMVNAAKRTMG